MLPNQEMSDRRLRWFGISLAGLVLCLGLMAYWHWRIVAIAVVTGVLAVVLLAVFYGMPASRRPIYHAFSTCVYPIQFLVTVLLLGIVYFGVVTPIALFLRLRGYDPLDRKSTERTSASTTLWVRRDPDPSDDRYFKTY